MKVINIFLWLIWNMIFGLMPLLIFLLLSKLEISTTITDIALKETNNLLKALIVLFFCVAIIGGLAWDFQFSKKKYKTRTYALMWCFVAIPLLISIIIYLPLVTTEYKDVNIHRLKTIQLTFLPATVIFCAFVKFALFKNEG